jgi:hypothetical protein
MANKFLKGEFTPTNPHKYAGGGKIIYRSSWEKHLMEKFDLHPDVVSWASEPFNLPYKNPITGKHTVYVPDFIVSYMDRNGKIRVEMIEIKPLKGVPGMPTGKGRSGLEQKLVQIINQAKWKAARSFCTKRGIFFRVMTEDQLF